MGSTEASDMGAESSAVAAQLMRTSRSNVDQYEVRGAHLQGNQLEIPF